MTYHSRRAGAVVLEVPITFVDRREGVSKMSGHTVSEALLLVTGLGLRRIRAGARRAWGLLGARRERV